MRLATLLCCLVFATSASAESFKQVDGAADGATEPAEPTTEEASPDESEAAEPAVDVEPAEETDTSLEISSPIVAPTVELVPDVVRYRFLSREEFLSFEEVTGFDGDEFLSCRDGDTEGRRARLVSNRVPLEITLTSGGDLLVRYTDEDEDGSIQECVDETLADMELEETPAELVGSRYRYIFYDDNYYSRRRMRHGEIVALYTLSGVSAGVAIGSFIAARNDDAEREEILSTVVEDSYDYDNVSNRALRFRRAGWSMVGLSVASFVGATLLYSGNRDIEGRENPVLVLSPGSPTGDLGFTLSGQF
jgi:hypothetical protein